MDFGSVLYKAQRNEESSKRPVTYYRTSFDPPKKEQREKKLSVNIQKFLARQEEEKKQKHLEEERKKQELFALRNKDKKSNKRIQSMLKRTKSANKSVLEDAVDNVNTAITAVGPLQPDEDDYGYVSKDASELYDRLVNRYANESQEQQKFSKSSAKSSSDILSTKDRVKAALLREEEEKLLPRKRKRKSKGEGGDGGEDDKESDDEPEEPVKKEKCTDDSAKKDKFRIPKKSAGPPPIDFQSLLKIAEQKQHEPIVIEKKVEEKPERLMTEKEKQEYLREKARKHFRDSPAAASKLCEALKKKDPAKLKNLSKEKSKPDDRVNTDSSPATVPPKSESSKKISECAKPSSASSSSCTSSAVKVKSAETVRFKDDVKSVNVFSDKNKSFEKVDSRKMLPPKTIPREQLPPAATKSKPASESKLMPRSDTLSKEQKQKLLNAKASRPASSVPDKVTKLTDSNMKSVKISEKGNAVATKKPEPSRPKQEMPARQFPPPDVRRSEAKKEMVASKSPGVRQFPPVDMMKKKKKPPVMRRHVIESDDEYDSEMDDFIDDSEDNNDVSKYISQIFGYDRSKYSRYDDDDDDDECMESNFSQLQKEEYISTKYGIMEDLADIRQTKLEKEKKKKRFR